MLYNHQNYATIYLLTEMAFNKKSSNNVDTTNTPVDIISTISRAASIKHTQYIII